MKKSFVFLLAFICSNFSVYSQTTPNNSMTLTEVEMQTLVGQVHTGKIKCELGQWVEIVADKKSSTQFYLEHKKERYHLIPVKTSTGALRLEDSARGAFWIQLANKSMLMSSKFGQRLADECKSPQQVAVSEAMRFAPTVNILEPTSDIARK